MPNDPIHLGNERARRRQRKKPNRTLQFVCLVCFGAGFLYLTNIISMNFPANPWGQSQERMISEHPNLSRVIDADTLVVGDVKVRLDGISAPERGHDAYTPGKWFVADLMASSTLVECLLEGRRSHDREIGSCVFVMPNGERIDPQTEAVKAGFARDCPRYSGGKYSAFETPESLALPLPNYC